MASPDLIEGADGQTVLRVPRGGDLEFDIAWTAGAVPVPITDLVRADVRNAQDEVVLDLDAHTTLVGGVAKVRVPLAVTVVLEDWGVGYWAVVADSAASGTRVLLEGPAFLRLTPGYP